MFRLIQQIKEGICLFECTSNPYANRTLILRYTFIVTLFFKKSSTWCNCKQMSHTHTHTKEPDNVKFQWRIFGNYQLHCKNHCQKCSSPSFVILLKTGNTLLSAANPNSPFYPFLSLQIPSTHAKSLTYWPSVSILPSRREGEQSRAERRRDSVSVCKCV